MPMQLIGTRAIKNKAVTGPKIWFAPDNTDDLGALGADRPRTVYAGTSFIGPGAIPAGGAANQVLAKTSATDYAVGWATPASGGLTLPLTQSLTFGPNATHDVGVSGFLPRDLILARDARVGGSLSLGATPAVLTSEGGDIKSLGALKAGNGYLFVDDCMIHREAANHLKFVGRFDTDELHVSGQAGIGGATIFYSNVGISGQLAVNPGQIVSTYDAPPISNTAYVDRGLTLQGPSGDAVGIGFHETSIAGLALYKAPGSYTDLRIRSNTGYDAKLMVTPTYSGNQGIGGYGGVSGGTGSTVLEASTVACSITTTGGLVFVIFNGTVQMNTAGLLFTMMIYQDGAAIGPVKRWTCALANQLLPVTLHAFYQPAAGVHEYRVYWAVGAGGSVLFDAGTSILLNAFEMK